MKRFSCFFLLIMIMSALMFTGCGSDKTSDVEEEIPDTINQVIEEEDVTYNSLNISELEVLAYEGDAEAQYQLGLIYEYGTESVNQDFAKAIDWYTQACVQEHPLAITALGYCYLTGTGVEKNIVEAKSYFEQGIELENINASVGLARAMLEELSDEDIARIHELEEEYPEVFYPAVVNSTESVEEEDEEANQKTDFDKADSSLINKVIEIFDLVQKAADSKDLDGVYFLGYLHENGIGSVAGVETAVSCYELAVSSESKELVDQYAIDNSNVALGILYMNGSGVEQNYETAMSFFETASDNGFAKASFYLGQIYENGLGIDKDYEKALEYYLKAAEKDFAPALNQIGYLYYNGFGVDVDFSSAVYYQKLAALQGYAPAQVNLGYLYENGYGVERNLETALSYYELASAAGVDGAEDAAIRVRALINEKAQ